MNVALACQQARRREQNAQTLLETKSSQQQVAAAVVAVVVVHFKNEFGALFERMPLSNPLERCHFRRPKAKQVSWQPWRHSIRRRLAAEAALNWLSSVRPASLGRLAATERIQPSWSVNQRRIRLQRRLQPSKMTAKHRQPPATTATINQL